jgi:putative phosphoesterase
LVLNTRLSLFRAGAFGSLPVARTDLQTRIEVDIMPMILAPKDFYRLGLIADTHGYLPSDALEVFRAVDLILHAGDIGSAQILRSLEQAAPVVAVRGNMDGGPWTTCLPEIQSVQAGSLIIHLVHDLLGFHIESDQDARVAVVNGHTHRPLVEKKNGVLFVNPGSAGAPRHGERSCVALLAVSGTCATAELISLRD